MNYEWGLGIKYQEGGLLNSEFIQEFLII